MRKVWCLHCEMVTEFPGEKQIEFPNTLECSNCGSGGMDVSDCTVGFFKKAYPDLKYEDIIVNKHYPLYP